MKGKEMDKTELLIAAKSITTETKQIEFKEHYDPNNKRLSLILIKEIVAFANTDGGVLLFNIDDSGKICNNEHYKIDLAPLVDKLFKYTGTQYDSIELISIKRNDGYIDALYISKSKYPLLFEKDGEYIINNKTKYVFRSGTIYVRHGSKSERANSYDIRNLLNDRIDEHMHNFYDKIKIFIDTPAEELDSISVIKQPNKIQFTDDPNAPEFKAEKSDKTHCRKLSYVVDKINEYVNKKHVINRHDIHCIKISYNINDKSKYCYVSQHYSCPVYNDAFIEWLKNEYDKDNMFFNNARKAAKKDQA